MDACVAIRRIRLLVRDVLHDLGAALASDPDEEAMLVVHELREREVEPALRRRAGAHRVAEAEPAGLGAVDDDDEDPLAPRRVVVIGVASAGEDPVLDPDRGQVAAAHAEEGERFLGRRLFLDLRCAAVQPGTPESNSRGEQELLPGVRPDREAEARLVVAALDAVRARVVDLRPARRQLVGRGQLVVEDRALAELGADDLVTACLERPDEAAQPIEPDHEVGCPLPNHYSDIVPKERPYYLGADAHPSCGLSAGT